MEVYCGAEAARSGTVTPRQTDLCTRTSSAPRACSGIPCWGIVDTAFVGRISPEALVRLRALQLQHVVGRLSWIHMTYKQ